MHQLPKELYMNATCEVGQRREKGIQQKKFCMPIFSIQSRYHFADRRQSGDDGSNRMNLTESK